jgi:hypothetical protein
MIINAPHRVVKLVGCTSYIMTTTYTPRLDSCTRKHLQTVQLAKVPLKGTIIEADFEGSACGFFLLTIVCGTSGGLIHNDSYRFCQ